jgi:YjbE family integral membrane protein
MLLFPLILLGSVIFLDICLSGDNAVVVAMAANALPKADRDSAIFLGLALAAILRMVLAVAATALLRSHVLAFIGGLALLWVAYRLGKDLLNKSEDNPGRVKPAGSFATALLTIVVADASMSLDNVLAVAALARNHPFIMILGIAASIVMLAFVARKIAGLLDRYQWINWVGLVLIVWVALDLVFGTYDSHLVMVRT